MAACGDVITIRAGCVRGSVQTEKRVHFVAHFLHFVAHFLHLLPIFCICLLIFCICLLIFCFGAHFEAANGSKKELKTTVSLKNDRPSYQESELPGSMHFDGEALAAILSRFRRERSKRPAVNATGTDAKGGEREGGGRKRSKRQGDWQDDGEPA